MSLRSHHKRLTHTFSLATLAALAACAGRTELADPPTPDASSVDASPEASPTEVGPNCTPVKGSDTGCGFSVSLPCGVERPEAGYLSWEACTEICTATASKDGTTWRGAGCGESSFPSEPMPRVDGGPPPPPPTGPIYAVTCYTCVAGRRPRGFSPAATAASIVGWLEQMSCLEAAAVTAFEHVRRDLDALGAGDGLLRAVDIAIDDEIRHTRTMVALAEAAGGAGLPPESVEYTRRDRLAVALENAVEGCVRETFGALVAEWQGQHAEYAPLRMAMRQIGRDERRHAALSWTIDGWLAEGLSAAERAEVALAIRYAIDTLKRDAYFDFEPEVLRALGLPNREETDALLSVLERELWATRLAA